MRCNLTDLRDSDQSSGLLRQLELTGKNNKEEAVVQKNNSRNGQRGPLKSLAEHQAVFVQREPLQRLATNSCLGRGGGCGELTEDSEVAKGEERSEFHLPEERSC